jgi:hypothetical protein
VPVTQRRIALRTAHVEGICADDGGMSRLVRVARPGATKRSTWLVGTLEAPTTSPSIRTTRSTAGTVKLVDLGASGIRLRDAVRSYLGATGPTEVHNQDPGNSRESATALAMSNRGLRFLTKELSSPQKFLVFIFAPPLILVLSICILRNYAAMPLETDDGTLDPCAPTSKMDHQ